MGQYNISSISTNNNLYYRLQPTSLWSCSTRNITDPANCVYYIGVTNYIAAPGNGTLVYSIAVGQPNEVSQLVDRTAQAGQVGPRELHHYQYVNTQLNPPRTIVFAVTATVGDVNIHVSNTPNAGPTNFIRSSTGSGDDVLVIVAANSPYYYVGVQNKLNSTSRYSVMGRAYLPGVPGSGSWSLQADQSFNDFCGRNDYSYYTFYVDGTWPTLTISVNARIGDPDIYVRHSVLDGSLAWPNDTHWRWRSIDFGSDTLSIPSPPTGTLYIALHAAVAMDAFYTISISGEGRTQIMSPGTTDPGELQGGKAQYYSALPRLSRQCGPGRVLPYLSHG